MVTTLGQRLRAAREKRGLSLEDAAHFTRIPAVRLRNLETDNYASFGSMTYARSFLKLYSRYLSVDASEILDDLPPARLGGRRDYRYLIEQFGPWIPEKRGPFAQLPAWSFRNRGARSPFATALGVFVAVLIGTGIWGGHVAGERAEMSKEQEKLAELHDQPAEDFAPVVAANSSLVPVVETRVQSAVPLKAIPVDPAAVPTLLREQAYLIEQDRAAKEAASFPAAQR